MRSAEALWKICMEIYQRMYEEAVPPLDFEKAMSLGYTVEKDWFLNHFLDMDRQKEIFDSVTKKYGCSEVELRRIRMEIWLGCSPRGVLKGDSFV